MGLTRGRAAGRFILAASCGPSSTASLEHLGLTNRVAPPANSRDSVLAKSASQRGQTDQTDAAQGSHQMGSVPTHPENGGAGTIPRAQNQNFSDADSEFNSPEQRAKLAREALSLYEFFEPGSKSDVILLGEPVVVEVHHVKGRKGKVLCTASTGLCKCCQDCGVDPDVSEQQTEYHIPAGKKEKDRNRYHQVVVVFSNALFHKKVRPILEEECARGVRLEVHKESSQKVNVKAVKGSARSRSATLPPSFELLPWVRARWSRPQDPLNPPVRIEPFKLQEQERTTGRPGKKLELAPSDRADAEELEAVKKKLQEARQRFAGTPTVSPIDPPAPAPAPAAPATPPPAAPAPAPAATAPVTPSLPEPAPSGFVAIVSPNPEPAPVSVTTPAPRLTLEQSLAAIGELEADLKAERPTSMVPSPELAVAAQERYARLRQANADAVEQERQLREQALAPKPEENRDQLRRRARNGEDLGAGRAVPAGGDFTAILDSIGQGGAK